MRKILSTIDNTVFSIQVFLTLFSLGIYPCAIITMIFYTDINYNLTDYAMILIRLIFIYLFLNLAIRAYLDLKNERYI